MRRDGQSLGVSGRGARNGGRRAEARGFILVPGVLLALCVVGPAAAAADEAPLVIRGAEHGPPVTPFVVDVDVRDLPGPEPWRPGDPIRSIPMRFYPPPGTLPVPTTRPGPDPLLEVQLLQAPPAAALDTLEISTPSRNFEGQGFTSVNPPDTVGDVGPAHYIQMINSGGGALVKIWDKAEPAPNELAAFVLDGLGAGACASGYGDPIVIYDRLADRWLLAEFASSGAHLCVYISRAGDPVTGGWYAYDFETPSFPDYPKYAAWATDSDGGPGSYVVTANDGGPGVYALDRAAMLAGEPSTFQRLTMPRLPGFGIQGPAPADPDGPNGPPALAPAIVMRHRDTELHDGPAAPADLLEMWLFQVDWDQPANTTLTQAPSIDVAEFDSAVCGTVFGGCFPQPGSTVTLMPLREVIMNRLQYYNYGDHESIAANFVVDVDGADHGGIRWFELRRVAGGPWALHTEGTFAPDDEHRWMGSAALDSSSNLALGYSVVSSDTYSSLRYTGRPADGPLGALLMPEIEMHTGAAANASYRWGDYAAMSLDPADDCTFWFTSMNNLTNVWRTQVASFRFRVCGCEVEPLPPPLEAAADGDNRIELFWEDSELAGVVEYIVQRSRTTGGPYETIGVVPDSSPGFAGGPGYAFDDTDVSGGTTYYYVVLADDGAACRSRALNEASATATGLCTLKPVFAGLRSAAPAAVETCAVDLAWDAASAECGGPAVYSVHRSTVPGFVPGPENLLVAGLLGTAVRDYSGLSSETPYYYVVRALDLANGVGDDNGVELSASPVGPLTGLHTLLSESFETAESETTWTVLTGPGSHECGEWARVDTSTYRPSGGSGFYMLALSEGCDATSTSLDSPAIDASMPGVRTVTLEFDAYYRYKNGDDATVKVWDGEAWQTIWTDPNRDANQHLSFDVTAHAAGNPAFRVRFDYQNAANDRSFAVDDVVVTADVVNSCTGSSAPPSVPSGEGTTGPLRATRLTPTGDALEIEWDASSCPGAGYNLLYGDLASVSAATPSGAACGIGTSGAYAWSSVPAGNLFFLVVGADGAGVESSWGESWLGERNGLTASGMCGATMKDVSNVCE